MILEGSQSLARGKGQATLQTEAGMAAQFQHDPLAESNRKRPRSLNTFAKLACRRRFGPPLSRFKSAEMLAFLQKSVKCLGKWAVLRSCGDRYGLEIVRNLGQLAVYLRPTPVFPEKFTVFEEFKDLSEIYGTNREVMLGMGKRCSTRKLAEASN